jgi:hypothetical protein
MVESFWTLGVMNPIRSFNRRHGDKGDLSSIRFRCSAKAKPLTVFEGFLPSSLRVAEDREIGVRCFDSYHQHRPTAKTHLDR